MRKIVFVFFIFCSFVLLYGQEVLRKRKVNSIENTTEVYYVLKSDNKIKHGSYIVKKDGDNILLEGYYKNGLKDSIWTAYSTMGIGRIMSKGKYLADKKVGIWEFYDLEGVPTMIIDESNKKVLKYTLGKEKDTIFNVVTDSGRVSLKLEQPPLYSEGSLAAIEYYVNKIRYPVLALEKKVRGRVIVTFVITEDGKAIDHKIINGIGSGCDEEALRVIKLIPDKWLPGIYKGKPVAVEFTMPVNFWTN